MDRWVDLFIFKERFNISVLENTDEQDHIEAAVVSVGVNLC